MQSMETKLDIDANELVLSTQSRTPSDIHQLSPAAIHRNGVNKWNKRNGLNPRNPNMPALEPGVESIERNYPL